MKILVDAQLPKSLAEMFRRGGFDAIHTLELPNKNLTTDSDICAIADNDDRVIITKDSDFLQSHILKSSPKRLIIVHTGNIKNSRLLEIFKEHISDLNEILTTSSLVEVYENKIIIH